MTQNFPLRKILSAQLNVTVKEQMTLETNDTNRTSASSDNTTSNFNPVEWNEKLSLGQITWQEFIDKLNELDIQYSTEPCKNNSKKANVKYEYDGFPYIFNVDISIIKGTKTVVPTVNSSAKSSSEKVYTSDNCFLMAGEDPIGETNESDNAHKDDFGCFEDIREYLLRDLPNDSDIRALNIDDSTYNEIAWDVINMHKDDSDYSKITKEQLKADFLTKYNASIGKTDEPNNSQFSSLEDIKNYIDSELRNDGDIKKLGWNKEFTYDDITQIVVNRYINVTDFSNITKESLKREFIDVYKTKANEYDNAHKDDLNSIEDIIGYLYPPGDEKGGLYKELGLDIEYDEYKKIADLILNKYKDGEYSSYVTKEQLKADFLTEYNASIGKTDEPNNSQFSSLEDIKNYIGSELRNDGDIKKLGWNKGFTYDDIAKIVVNRYINVTDFSNITKESLKREFSNAYHIKANEYDNAHKDDLNGFEDIRDYLLYDLRDDSDIRALNIDDSTYDDIAWRVCRMHKDDDYSTKGQLKSEFLAEYNASR